MNSHRHEGLFMLARILFGGFGFGMKGRMMDHHKNPIHDKWMKMTPEQRREFIKEKNTLPDIRS